MQQIMYSFSFGHLPFLEPRLRQIVRLDQKTTGPLKCVQGLKGNFFMDVYFGIIFSKQFIINYIIEAILLLKHFKPRKKKKKNVLAHSFLAFET